MLNFMAIVYMVQTLIAPAFSKRIIQHLEEKGHSDYIICVDFNLVLGPYIDCSNYKNVNNPISRELHLDYMENNNVIDPFVIVIHNSNDIHGGEETLVSRLD